MIVNILIDENLVNCCESLRYIYINRSCLGSRMIFALSVEGQWLDPWSGHVTLVASLFNIHNLSAKAGLVDSLSG